jgi:hypothetical protein
MRSFILTVRSIASLTGLALLPAAAPAFAQGQTEAVTEISFDLIGVYEDNVARSSDALAQQRGLEQEDFTLSPTVSLNIVRLIGTTEFAVTGQLGYVFHANNSELDRERIGISARAETPVGPCRIGPELGFQRRQSDLRDIVFLPAVGANAIRNTETVQTYGLSLACGRNPGLQPFAAVTAERAENSSTLRERAEYDAITYRGGLRYSSAAVGEISLFASRKETDLSPLAFAGGGDPSYNFDEVGIELRRDIGSRIQATASVGYGRLDSDNLFIESFKGVTWNLELSALIGANLRVTAGTGREVGNSLASDAGFVVSTPHQVRLEYAFSERARLDLGGSITKRRFGYDVAPGPFAITNETLRRIDGGLSYDLGRRFNVRIFGGHERRSANGTLFDYSASFAGASIGLRF